MNAEVEKLRSKLKALEISFEQINNSRNDLLKQLVEQELLNEKIYSELLATQDFYISKIKQVLKLQEKIACIQQKYKWVKGVK